jgi:precorrin isomerase
MVDMLPKDEQDLAYEILRRMILAWDPDYTKATPIEAAAMEQGLAEYKQGEAVSLDDIK